MQNRSIFTSDPRLMVCIRMKQVRNESWGVCAENGEEREHIPGWKYSTSKETPSPDLLLREWKQSLSSCVTSSDCHCAQSVCVCACVCSNLLICSLCGSGDAVCAPHSAAAVVPCPFPLHIHRKSILLAVLHLSLPLFSLLAITVWGWSIYQAHNSHAVPPSSPSHAPCTLY